ncbi:MAG: PAS domain S-box protein, partial [Candidatus Electrothrix sp. AR3]|nr:PAS domain S-box protein [Candidatus Electrothrix sp. AR3]
MNLPGNAPQQYIFSGNRFFLLVVASACLLLSLTAFCAALSWEKARFEFDFERQARNQANQIEETFHEYQVAVQFVGNFLENTVSTSRKEFKGFAENILKTYPGMQAVSWNLRIRDQQRFVYEEAGKKEGFQNFHFSERDAQKKLIPAAQRSEYVIVYYIEPLKGNEAALGFDIASNSKRLESINKAGDSGNVVVTEKISLVQEKEQQTGVLILSPLYKHGAVLNTSQERHTYLEGFSVGVLRIDQVLKNNLFRETDELMDIYLYDESAEKLNQLLYCMVNGDQREAVDKKRIEAHFHWTSTFTMGGRKWRIILVPSVTYKRYHRSLLAWSVLAVSLLFSLLLLLYLQKNFDYTKKLEQYQGQLENLVQKRTFDLHSVNKELEQEVFERKQAGTMLRKSEARIRAVVDNLIDGIITIDEKGIVEFFNPAAELIFGFQAEEVIGRKVNMLMPEPHYSLHDTYLANYHKTGEAKIIGIGQEVPGKRKDGSIFQMDLSVNLMELDEQRMFTAIIRDITRKKQTQKELLQAKEAAEAANQAKGEFLANISHEIRTPMTAVLGFSDILSSLIVDQQQQKYLESIQVAGRGLLTLINDILDLSKIEAGRLVLQYERINPQEIFNEIKLIFFQKISEKNLHFIVDIDSELPTSLLIDEIRLRQILLNLVGNA